MAPKTVKVHPELTLIFTEFATDFHQAPWKNRLANSRGRAGPGPEVGRAGGLRDMAGPSVSQRIFPRGVRENVAVRARVVSHAGVCHGLWICGRGQGLNEGRGGGAQGRALVKQKAYNLWP